jgi:hypothetical protein
VQDVEATEPVERFGNHRLDGFLVGDVGFAADRTTTSADDFGGPGFGGFAVDVGEHDGCAATGELRSARGADPAAGSGDDRNFSVHAQAFRLLGIDQLKKAPPPSTGIVQPVT